MNGTGKKLAAVILMGVIAMGAAGCSNQGGRTTCGDFMAMTIEARTEAVTKMMKDRGGTPDDASVAEMMTIVRAFCEHDAAGSAKIEEAYQR
jgi:hypothetical protein